MNSSWNGKKADTAIVVVRDGKPVRIPAAQLREQQKEAWLDTAIEANLRGLGYGE